MAVARCIEELEARRLLAAWPAAALMTDLPDYAPGDIVHITGSGFLPGETVQLQVLHAPGTTGDNTLAPYHSPWLIADGGPLDLDRKRNGIIQTTWTVNDPDARGASYALTATGLKTQLTAQTTFTDATITISSNTNWSAITTGSAPDHQPSSSDTISISPGVTLTVDVANAVAQTINVNISGGGAAGTLTFNAGSVLTVGSIIEGGANSAYKGDINMTSGGILKISQTFTYHYGTFTAGGGTVEYNGSAQTITANNGSGSNIVYNDLTTSNAGTKSLGGNLTVNGDLTIGSATTVDAVSAYTISIAGSLTNNGAFNAQTGTVTFIGAAGQSVGGSASTIFYNLTVNAPGGLSLAKSETVNHGLTLTSGKVSTGANVLVIASGAWVNGASGSSYVVGNLKKSFSSSVKTATFDVGTETDYTPATITFASVSTSGSLAISATGGEHTLAAYSAIDTSRDVNAYWTLTNSGIGFTSYSAAFTFTSRMLDPGANTTTFRVANNGSGTWITAANQSRTTTSTAATSLTTFGDFIVGELDTTAPTVSAASSSLANGSYAAGAVIPIQITFSEPVTVTGAPRLALATIPPTTVNYSAGSGTTTLTFNYTVAAGQSSPDLDYASATALELNGGAIKDLAGNAASLILPTPGAAGSLAANKGLAIDTAAPTLTPDSGSLVYTPHDAATAISSGLIATDSDSAVFVSATISITSGFADGQDVLAASTSGTNITANYSAGVLTLSGSDTLAHYQDALRSVTFFNSSDSPSADPRIVCFVATDIAGNRSAPATRNITITSTNRPPVVDPVDSQTIGYGSTLSFIASASDPEGAFAFSLQPDTGPGGTPVPAGASIDAAGHFLWTPGPSQVGTHQFLICATDTGMPALVGSQVLVITVIDTTPPVISLPAEELAPIIEATSATGTPFTFHVNASDAVWQNVTLTCEPSLSVYPLGTTHLIWTATDGSGNSATAQADITVIDTTPPVISLPAEELAPIIEATGATGTPFTFHVNASDAVWQNVTLTCEPSLSVYPLGTTHLIWTATDGSGNSATAQADITVIDTTPPVISLPAEELAPIIEATSATGTPFTFHVNASDTVWQNVTLTCEPSLSVYPLGTTHLIWTATDGSGNSATAQADITVIDTTPPVISLSADELAPIIEATGATGTPFTFHVNASDTVWQNVTLTCEPSLSVYPLGTTHLIWTATDGSGNSATAQADITVIDTTPPVISLPADELAPIIEATSATGTPFTFHVNASDTVWQNVTLTCEPSLSVYPLGTTHLIWTATDGSGNSATAQADITVIDTTPPVISLPADELAPIIEATGATGAPFTFHVNASDTVWQNVTLTCEPSLSVYPLGTTHLIWTATDGSGNSATAQADITVVDTTPPVISLPAEELAPIIEATSATGAPFTFHVNASDTVWQNVTLTCEPSLSVYPLGTTHLIWTATDGSGNSATAQADITVIDTTPPVISLPADELAPIIEATSATGAPFTFHVNASDTVWQNVTLTCEPALSVYPLGTTHIIWTATDGSGNSATAHADITVIDTTPPVISLPADELAPIIEATSATGTPFTFHVNASDAVWQNVTLTCEPSLSVYPLGTTHLTWTATDGSGNSATAHADITVIDTTPPIISLPAEELAPIIEATGATGTPFTFHVNASDAVWQNVTLTCEPSLSVYPLGTTHIIWTATDGSGNSATAHADITVIDTTPPVISLPAEELAPIIEATSATGTPFTFHVNASDTVWQNVTLTCEPSLSVYPLGTTHLIWTATDGSGNSATAQADITVIDTTPPVLSLPGNQVFAATSSDGAFVIYVLATAVDLADPQVVITHTPPPGSQFPLGMTTVQVQAIDHSGNIAYGAFTINVAGADLADTTTAVDSADATYGDASVTLTAHVIANPSMLIVDEGSVTFTITGNGHFYTLENVPVTAGIATSGFSLGGIGAGSYSIAATYNPSASEPKFNGSGSAVAGILNIRKAAANVSVAPIGVGYDGSAHSTTGTARGIGSVLLGTVAMTYDTGDGLAPVDAGDYTATGTFAGDSNYFPATGFANIHIDQADAVIQVSDYTGIYDGAAHGITSSATGVTGEDLTALLNFGNTFVDAGDHTATWSFPGSINYKPATGSANIHIDRADAVISITDYTGIYDGAAHGITGSATGVTGEDLTALLNLGNTFVDAGDHIATWSFVGNINYKSATGAANIHIDQADAVISITDYTGIYDGAAHGITGSATGVIGEDLTALLNLGNTFVDAGDHTATWSFPGSINYKPATGSANIHIDQADAVISITDYTGIYDGAAHGIVGSATGVTGEDLTALLNLGNTFVDAGDHTATWSFPGSINYKPATGSANIHIDQATLTVTADDQCKCIGSADPILTCRITCGTLMGGDRLSGCMVREDGEDVGCHAIVQGSLTAGPNYVLNFVPGTLTILSLSDSTPPTVTQVLISGSSWAIEPFSIPSGPDQLLPLPWVNLNRITIVFSEDVSVTPDALMITGVNVPMYGLSATDGFTYDPITHTGRWTLEHAIAADKISLNLTDSLTDAAGNQLDGDWADGAHAFPSGNGSAGGVFAFRLNILPGDANRSGLSSGPDAMVNTDDLARIRTAQMSPVGSAKYSPFCDLDGSGRIDILDLATVQALQATQLPSAEPPLADFAATPPQDTPFASHDSITDESINLLA